VALSAGELPESLLLNDQQPDLPCFHQYLLVGEWSVQLSQAWTVAALYLQVLLQ
jgi:hypothetical protein